MQIKSILCAYSGEAAKGSGLRHAIRLAKHHDAHLTGILRHGRSYLDESMTMRISEEVRAQVREANADHIQKIAMRFNAMVSEGGVSDKADFVELDPEEDGSISSYAYAYDLVVTGVHSARASEAHFSAHPDIIALKSGRPVLVVPNEFEASRLADRALVAWDGKRSAARAIGDAMSILAERSHVMLLSVGDVPHGTDRMIANLKRHGVVVESGNVARRGSIASSLLSAVEDTGANLMVMGAFEHSKFAHDLFGGVTTDVIKKSSVPIFIAH